jgi:peroxiredoxin Q/BCP
MSLSIGSPAPEFTLPDGNGGTISLKQFRGRKVVLYFYPKDDTPGCTKEACAFRDNLKQVERRGAAVIGVSADSPASHAKFAEKYGLPFPLVSDQEKRVVKDYGVWKKKNRYGRTYMGIERTTFVIDENGKIAHIFPNVKVDGHADEVLAVL